MTTTTRPERVVGGVVWRGGRWALGLVLLAVLVVSPRAWGATCKPLYEAEARELIDASYAVLLSADDGDEAGVRAAVTEDYDGDGYPDLLVGTDDVYGLPLDNFGYLMFGGQ